MQSLAELQELFDAEQKYIDSMVDAKWAALSAEDQLDYFCAVVKRIHHGEVEKNSSYRGILYNVFGFGPDSYARAQLSGFLDLHNLIYTHDYEKKLLSSYGKYLADKFNLPEIDQGQLISDFYKTQ